MWLFNKKKEDKKNGRELDEGIPTLPELPKLPQLPPIPRTLENEDISHAISSVPKLKSELREEDELPPLPTPSYRTHFPMEKKFAEKPLGRKRKPLTREIDESKLPKMPFIPKLRETYSRETKPSIKNEPIFVRIDKYQAALGNLQEAKKKIMEIENLLKELKELKIREEAELQEWESEIQGTKEKLDRIDRTIFNKLEE